MVITVDDIVKLSITFALCFSIIGISWQLMNVLREFVETVKETNSLIRFAQDFLAKFDRDYDFIIEKVKTIVSMVSQVGSGVANVAGSISSFIKKKK